MTWNCKPARIVAVLLGILLFLIVADSIFSVDQGERAVVLRFGKVQSVAEPGLHFKIPCIDSIIPMSVRTEKGSKSLEVYSKDVQAAVIKLSVNYRINSTQVAEIYEKYGENYVERIIDPQLISCPKDIFGKYNAVDIVQNRDKLTAKISEALQAKLISTGVTIETIQIENIDFSDAYEKSVEERMKAEVEVQKVLQNEAREKISANIVRVKAQAIADAKLVQAEAEAKSVTMLGEAQAMAIAAKALAMQKNPQYVQLLQAERWNGVLPTTMIPDQALPIISGITQTHPERVQSMPAGQRTMPASEARTRPVQQRAMPAPHTAKENK